MPACTQWPLPDASAAAAAVSPPSSPGPPPLEYLQQQQQQPQAIGDGGGDLPLRSAWSAAAAASSAAGSGIGGVPLHHGAGDEAEAEVEEDAEMKDHQQSDEKRPEANERKGTRAKTRQQGSTCYALARIKSLTIEILL